MKESILEKLGLSPNEAKIYLSVLENGESSVGKISLHAKIHRRNVYDAIRRLLDKGLVFEVWSSKESMYGVVDPEKLRELLVEKQTELELAMPELINKYQQTNSDQASFMFEGYQGMKNILRQIVKTNSKVYTLGGKGQWFDPNLDIEREIFFKTANKQKIKFQILFDHQALDRFPQLQNYYKGMGDYRILPADYDTSCTIHIYGDYVVIYNGVGYGKLDPNCKFFIMKSEGIANSYRSWFEFMWTRSKENKKTSRK